MDSLKIESVENTVEMLVQEAKERYVEMFGETNFESHLARQSKNQANVEKIDRIQQMIEEMQIEKEEQIREKLEGNPSTPFEKEHLPLETIKVT